MGKTIWINCCEPSADVYASQLITWLKTHHPQINIIGMGGELSRKAGLKALFRAEELSVMGFTEVFSALPHILKLLRDIKQSLKKARPDLILLLDAPDFNFRLAKYAWQLNIPVFYYIAPQVWAWRKNRVHFLKKYIKKIFCIFPFEEDFLKQYKVNTSYVGNPLLDIIDFNSFKNITREKNKILLLPGSRYKEVHSLLPLFNEVCLNLQQKKNYQFTLIKADNIDLKTITQYLSPQLNCKIVERKYRYQEMASSYLALAASGTVTLECALMQLPTIITYKVSSLTYLVGKLLIDVPAIGMPNLILKEKIFPEYIQKEANVKNILQSINLWEQEKTYNNTILKLKEIKTILGNKKASQSVGEELVSFLEQLN